MNRSSGVVVVVVVVADENWLRRSNHRIRRRYKVRPRGSFVGCTMGYQHLHGLLHAKADGLG